MTATLAILTMHRPQLKPSMAFTSELQSEIECVNSDPHVSRFRGKMLRPCLCAERRACGELTMRM